MRSHGVQNWPDPNTSGSFDKSKIGLQQLGVSSVQLQSADNACKPLLPNGSAPSQGAQQQANATALEFSQCMRTNGVTNFPDPDSTGRIPDPASLGIDQGAPRFQAANTTCGEFRPSYIPSNAAYEAYATAHPGTGS